MKLANRSKVYTSVSIVFDNRENCKQCQPSLNGLVSTGVFPCHCAVYMYKIMILQKPLSQFPPHWSYCWNVIDSLFKRSRSIDCQAHIFFFKTKNCSNGDLFISCDDRIGKMLHNICISAVAMSLRWARHGPWASCSTSAFEDRRWVPCVHNSSYSFTLINLKLLS